MSFQRPSRAKARITGQSGTGTMTLSGTGDSSLKTFVQALGGLSTYMVDYTISGTNVYEEGTGLFTASGTTLTRPSANVAASSNAGALLNLSSGATYDVIIRLSGPSWYVDTGTADRTLSVKDRGNLQQLTGSTARTLTLPAVAGVPDGFHVPLENASSAVWTIDGNSTEVIRVGSANAQTQIILPGDSADLWLDQDRAAWRLAYRQNPANSGGHGQCRLTLSGGNLLLSPCNGNGIKIAGQIYPIPAAGVTYSPSSLSAGTTYNIYVWMSSGVMTMGASTGASGIDTTPGNIGTRIEAADPTRTFVGLARAISASAFADSLTQRFVISYFNRRNLPLRNYITADRTITSASWAEFNSEIRCEFLTWGDESVHGSGCGTVNANTTGVAFVGAGIDGATPDFTQDVNSGTFPFASPFVHAPSEGYHYMTMMGKSNGSNNLTLEHYASSEAASLMATIRG